MPRRYAEPIISTTERASIIVESLHVPGEDVQRLRAFVLVVDLGSISAAASALGYTQSAVSQQLAALEREVGTALVNRSQRPLRATRAGEVLRPQVERVLAALGGAEAALEDLRDGSHRVRLAAFTSALSSFVPAAVRGLRRAHPAVVLQVLQLETRRRWSASGAVTPTWRWSTTCPGSPCPRPRASSGADSSMPLRGAARGPPACAARCRERRGPRWRAADPAAATRLAGASVGGRASLRAGGRGAAGGVRSAPPPRRAGLRRGRHRRRPDARPHARHAPGRGRRAPTRGAARGKPRRRVWPLPAARTPVVDDLLERLAAAARAYERRRPALDRRVAASGLTRGAVARRVTPPSAARSAASWTSG